MKKIKKITANLLMILLLICMFPARICAEETYGYAIDISPTTTAIGGEVTLTIRLTDYAEEKSGIRGFQIDITDVDDVLHSAQCTSLVEDKEEVSEAAKYQKNREIVRHAYVKLSGTMSYADSNLLEVKFTIPEKYTEAGTLSLPLRILIQNAAGDKLIYKDTININYAPESEIPSRPDPEVVNVDISWGKMEFTYTDGTWNTRTYMYEGAGWTDDGTGYVTVSNTGKIDTTVTFSYTSDREDILGTFNLTSPVELISGTTVNAKLSLSGKPEEYLDNNIIGKATVTIGGAASD